MYSPVITIGKSIYDELSWKYEMYVEDWELNAALGENLYWECSATLCNLKTFRKALYFSFLRPLKAQLYEKGFKKVSPTKVNKQTDINLQSKLFWVKSQSFLMISIFDFVSVWLSYECMIMWIYLHVNVKQSYIFLFLLSSRWHPYIDGNRYVILRQLLGFH